MLDEILLLSEKHYIDDEYDENDVLTIDNEVELDEVDDELDEGVVLNRDEQLVILRIERLDDKVEIAVILLQLVDDDDELCVLDVNLQGVLQVRV